MAGTDPIDLKQLRFFVTLADVGNIRRAAAMLALSQPTLSMRMQRLEASLGFALFDRQARGVALTERGVRFLPHAKRLLARSGETAEAARAIGRGAFDRLEIGLTPIAALSFMPAALRRFLSLHLDVQIALTEGLSDELEEAVAHRALDFAIVHPPSPRDDLVAHEVARDRFVAVVPEGHPLARATRLEAADFRGQTLVAVRREVGPAVFDRITSYFSRAGVAVPISQSATSSISLIGLVAAGAGIGFVVDSLRCIRRDDVRYVALSDDAPTLGYALCHRPDMPDALHISFARAMAEVAAAALARRTTVEP